MALVTVEGLSCSYPAAPPALRDVSIALEPGEVIALLGPSGSGKTTLLRALAGLVPHFHGGRFEGRVVVAGLDTRSTRPAELAGTVATVFQDPEDQVVMTIVANEVAFGLENLGVPPLEIWPRVEQALESVDALHLWGRKTIELSGGELQRVCLASALALQPRLLLLDEPTSQLDPEAATLFLAAVERLGATVVLSEQRVARALELATRVLFVDGGRVLLDAPRAEGVEWLAAERPLYTKAWVKNPFQNDRSSTGRAGRVRAEDAGSPRAGSTWATEDEGSRRSARSGDTALRSETGSKPTHASAGEIVLDASGVSFAYREAMPVLDSVDLQVSRGEIVVLQGANGSGKTTLARVAAGLLEAQSGSVELRGRAGYLSQDPGRYLVKETALHEVGLAVNGDEQRARAALGRAGLDWAADRHPRDLSSGERERLALAAVAVAEPDLLVLDEPTRGLDPERKAALGAWLQEYAASGKGVLVATHDRDLPASRRIGLGVEPAQARFEAGVGV